MPTYDVPGVGQVSVTFSSHEFGNSSSTLRSLDEVRDATGQKVPFPVWETVNAHLRSLGVVA